MKQEEFLERLAPMKGRLYRTAWAYLGGEAAALEAVDETVYQGLRHLRSLRQPEFFETWLTRILINVCKKELQRQRRFRWADPMPEAGADFDYDALPLREAIAHLPEELRRVVALRYFADLTLAQTAAILGIPQGTVVTRQRRALALLKLELKEVD